MAIEEAGPFTFRTMIVGLVILIIACVVLDWMIGAENFYLYKVFAPKEAEVQKQIESKANPVEEVKMPKLKALCDDSNLAHAMQDNERIVQDNVLINEQFGKTAMADVPEELRSCLLKVVEPDHF